MEFDIDNMDFALPDQLYGNAGESSSNNMGDMTTEQLKEEIKDWMCIYPVYIDSRKTKEQGRKLGKEFCYEKPHILAMAEAMKKLKISTVIEDKKHPRDQLNIGRLRVNYTGSKKELLKKIAELVPECQKVIEEKRKAMEASKSSSSSSSSKPASSGNTNNKKSNKKKGKKRR